jgi:hypothetical protein
MVSRLLREHAPHAGRRCSGWENKAQTWNRYTGVENMPTLNLYPEIMVDETSGVKVPDKRHRYRMKL